MVRETPSVFGVVVTPDRFEVSSNHWCVVPCCRGAMELAFNRQRRLMAPTVE